jgi:uncharacterized protein (TIGR03083 family)
MTSGTQQEGHGPVLSAVRQRVLETAMRERAPRHSVLRAEDITPPSALRRTADALDTLLGTLSDADWRRPALRGLDVQGLVGHLIGVERHAHRCLRDGGDPTIADADHVASTNAAVGEQLGRSPEATRADLRAAIDHTLQLVDAMPEPADQQVAMHGMRLSVPGFLVVRSFELWTHDNDIRRATGRAAARPDASTLQLMTALAAQMVPTGVRKASGGGLARPIRLVLTGQGGGVWDLGCSDGGEPAARIVCDAVDFCRVVAHRLAPGKLVMDVWGERRLIDTVLTGASALALD